MLCLCFTFIKKRETYAPLGSLDLQGGGEVHQQEKLEKTEMLNYYMHKKKTSINKEPCSHHIPWSWLSGPLLGPLF